MIALSVILIALSVILIAFPLSLPGLVAPYLGMPVLLYWAILQRRWPMGAWTTRKYLLTWIFYYFCIVSVIAIPDIVNSIVLIYNAQDIQYDDVIKTRFVLGLVPAGVLLIITRQYGTFGDVIRAFFVGLGVCVTMLALLQHGIPRPGKLEVLTGPFVIGSALAILSVRRRVTRYVDLLACVYMVMPIAITWLMKSWEWPFVGIVLYMIFAIPAVRILSAYAYQPRDGPITFGFVFRA